MGARLAKLTGTCACWLAALGTAACEGSWGDGSYGTTCYAERTCDAVMIVVSGGCIDEGDPEPITIYNEDAARCVLEQLRDANTGGLVIDLMQEEPIPCYCGTLYEAHIIPGDRRAVVVKYEYLDVGAEPFPMKAVLKSSDEYQGCLEDGPTGYAACLVNAFEFRSGETTCGCDYCHPE